MTSLLSAICDLHGYKLKNAATLSGGDISAVYLLVTSKDSIVAKINSATAFPEMFSAESKGLNLLASSKSFRIPRVVGNGLVEDSSYLLLEYIRPGDRKANFWEEFGRKLAMLHSNTNRRFGCDHSNYIGSLPQTNNWYSKASEFYINERLEPQFKIAMDKGYAFEELGGFFTAVSKLIPDEAPSLIHGDLWSGNFLVSETGDPVLIDPAVAYSIREMDIAMMQLFGGFPQPVFYSYNELMPLYSDWQDRIKLFQLYYLLVHLNLFGSGYLSQVKAAMKPYF